MGSNKMRKQPSQWRPGRMPPYPADPTREGNDLRLVVFLPRSMIEALDKARGETPRSAFVRDALKARLQ